MRIVAMLSALRDWMTMGSKTDPYVAWKLAPGAKKNGGAGPLSPAPPYCRNL